MSDNTQLNSGSGGDTIRTVDRTSSKTQVVQLDWGGDTGVGNEQLGTLSNPFPTGIGATYFTSSTNNSSVTQLGYGQTFTGVIESTFNTPLISILMTCDQPVIITINLYIDALGQFPVRPLSWTVPAGQTFDRGITVNSNFVNVTVQNIGTGPTTTFNLNSSYGFEEPVTQLGNQPVEINAVAGIAIPQGGSVPVNVTGSVAVADPVTQAAQTSDTPIFMAITGDPAGDFAGVDLMSALFDPSTGLSPTVIVQNQPNTDLQNRLVLSDCPTPINMSGPVGKIFYIDTTGYQSINITSQTMAANIAVSDDRRTWTALSGFNKAIAAAYVTAFTAGGAFSFPCIGRFLQITVTTIGTATAYLRNSPWVAGYSTPLPSNMSQIAGVAVSQASSQLGVNVVNIGGTANAAPAGQFALGATAASNGITIGTPVVVAATPVANTIKAGAGRLISLTIANSNTTGVWCKLFNSAPTVGTTSALYNIYVAPTSSYAFPISDLGMYFSTGIYYTVTGAISLTDSTAITASTCCVSFTYI